MMTDIVESKAKAALAYLMDHIVYSDSYGVHGSDFAACRLCNGGGAPGVPLVHEETCPAARYGDVAQEWWDERDQERKEATDEIERLRAAAQGAISPARVDMLRRALERVQWAARDRFRCVDCGGKPSIGHTNKCLVGRALSLTSAQ